MIYALLFIIIFIAVFLWSKESNQADRRIFELNNIIEIYHEGIVEMSKKGLHPGCSCGNDDVDAGWCMNCCFMTAELNRADMLGEDLIGEKPKGSI